MVTQSNYRAEISEFFIRRSAFSKLPPPFLKPLFLAIEIILKWGLFWFIQLNIENIYY